MAKSVTSVPSEARAVFALWVAVVFMLATWRWELGNGPQPAASQLRSDVLRLDVLVKLCVLGTCGGGGISNSCSWAATCASTRSKANEGGMMMDNEASVARDHPGQWSLKGLEVECLRRY